MYVIEDDSGEIAGVEGYDGTFTVAASDAGRKLQSMLDSGVPGLRSETIGDVIVEREIHVPPTDLLFNVALVEHLENIGWSISDNPLAVNMATMVKLRVGTEAYDLCTPEEWDAFTEWAVEQDTDEYPELTTLAAVGESTELDDLADEAERADIPISASLLEALANREDGDSAVVEA